MRERLDVEQFVFLGVLGAPENPVSAGAERRFQQERVLCLLTAWRRQFSTIANHPDDTYIVDVKVRDMLALLAKDGWVLAETKGSHRQFKHAQKPGRVTVAGKPGDELHPKTARSIRRQAGL